MATPPEKAQEARRRSLAIALGAARSLTAAGVTSGTELGRGVYKALHHMSGAAAGAGCVSSRMDCAIANGGRAMLLELASALLAHRNLGSVPTKPECTPVLEVPSLWVALFAAELNEELKHPTDANDTALGATTVPIGAAGRAIGCDVGRLALESLVPNITAARASWQRGLPVSVDVGTKH